ncbi:hypothetical protein MKX03_015849 [Papaver bracteatum]|nr:hypothetical protein MKX03_015849 [Papaver bracteatum]
MNIVSDDIIVANHNKALEFIKKVTTNTDKVQKAVLSEILSISSQVEYLQRYGLNGRTDRETYRNVIPIATYESIKPFLERIANGDTSPILCGRPITNLLLSSGTSGSERKIFPCIEEEMDRIRFANCLVMPVVSKYIAGMDKGKAMIFMFSRENTYTPEGLPIITALTRYYQSSQFQNRPYDPFEDYTSPAESIFCADFEQSTYSQCLCGLFQSKSVVRVGSHFVYTLLRIIHFTQKHWTLLCDDIRTGTINTQIMKDVLVREAIKKIIVKPDPELADFIENECKRDDSWKGIVSRLWPNAKYIESVITGSMSQHIRSIDFYTSGLPSISTRYLCSKYFFGINLQPDCKPEQVSYTFLPNLSYFEFLPISDENHQKNNNQHEQHGPEELVELADVKLGYEYAVYVTTYTGKYTFIVVGDVLRVVGFNNTAQNFQYIRRKKILLGIDCEKTTEGELHNAVQMVPCFSGFRHSRFSRSTVSKSMFEKCCFMIEDSLSYEYKRYRTFCKSIGPLEIKIVEMGTFDKLMDYAISQGSTGSQYKTPRNIKNVELLNSCIVSSYFSQEFPHYALGI